MFYRLDHSKLLKIDSGDFVILTGPEGGRAWSFIRGGRESGEWAKIVQFVKKCRRASGVDFACIFRGVLL